MGRRREREDRREERHGVDWGTEWTTVGLCYLQCCALTALSKEAPVPCRTKWTVPGALVRGHEVTTTAAGPAL